MDITNCPFCNSDDLSETELRDGYSRIYCVECEADAIMDGKGWVEWVSRKTRDRAEAACA